MLKLNDTANRVLDVAEHFTQTRGFNAFSYKDIQNEVGVKTSSIHYYFPTKQDLAVVMTERFTQRLEDTLKELTEQNDSAIARINAFNALHISLVDQGKFCLGGMLASDILGLPELANGKLDRFFHVIEQWLKEAIALGQEQGSIQSTVNSEKSALTYLAALEGGMLIARAKKQPQLLEQILDEALALITG